MIYLAQDRWQTYGRYPDGGEYSSYLGKPSIGQPNMIMSYDYVNDAVGEWNDPTMAITIELKEGWNWTSHNLNSAIHTSRYIGYAQHIMGAGESYIKDENSVWSGNLKGISPATGYKIKMSENADITLRGELFDTTVPVTLKKGWNWVGCPLYNATVIEEALKEYTPTEGDAIIGVNSFATYEDGEWTGTLSSLSPGQSYLLKCGATQRIHWNSFSKARAKSRRYSAPEQEVQSGTPWQTDMHAHPYAIGVIATIDGDVSANNCTVAAFCDNECRGVAQVVDGLLYMNIYGEGDETIRFKSVDNGGEIIEFEQILRFAPEAIIGSRKSPLLLTHKYSCIETPALSDLQIVSTIYYTLSGQRVDYPSSGIFIKKTVYENGYTEVKKIKAK